MSALRAKKPEAVTKRLCGTAPAHVVTTSYLTHDAVEQWMCGVAGYPGPLALSPGKTIGHGIGHALSVAVDAFSAHAQQRERCTPRIGSGFPKAHVDGGVPVGVPRNGPFKSEVAQRWVFY